MVDRLPFTMPTRTRRAALRALPAAVAAGPLAACGLGPQPDSGAAGDAPPPTALSGTIQFWHGWTTPATQPLMRAVLDRLQAQNPGVTVEETPGATGQDKVVGAVAAGTPPDCLHLFPALYPFVVPSKAVVPLESYVARDRVDLKQLNEADVKLRTLNGQLVALPTISAASGVALYWNKEHFRQAGLNPEQPPRTWSEVEQFAQRLTRPGERIGIDPLIRSGVKNDVAARFVAWLYQNGGTLFSEDGKKVAFAGRETSDAIEWLKRLMERQGSPEPLDQTASRNAFFQGRASMFTEIDNFPAQIRADANGKDMDFGVAPMAVNDRNARARLSVPGRPGHGYAVMANAKNRDGAWALMTHLVLGDAQCGFYTKAQGRISPLKRCNADPDVLKLPEIQTYARYSSAIVAVPFAPGDGDAVGVLEAHAQRAINGQVAVDAAIQDATRDAQKALDDAWTAWNR